jgi:hypothetical protein
MWNIRRVLKSGPYLVALVPEHPKANVHGLVLHHRVVMENKLGRILVAGEVVHHKDRDKHNNDEDNLEVMSSSEHSRLHAKKGRTFVTLRCFSCGTVFEREIRQFKTYHEPHCSRRCIGISTAVKRKVLRSTSPK